MQYKGGYLICDYGSVVMEEFDNGELLPRYYANRGGKIVIDLKTGEFQAYEKTW